jgi:hypothetical protein
MCSLPIAAGSSLEQDPNHFQKVPIALDPYMSTFICFSLYIFFPFLLFNFGIALRPISKMCRAYRREFGLCNHRETWRMPFNNLSEGGYIVQMDYLLWLTLIKVHRVPLHIKQPTYLYTSFFFSNSIGSTYCQFYLLSSLDFLPFLLFNPPSIRPVSAGFFPM